MTVRGFVLALWVLSFAWYLWTLARRLGVAFAIVMGCALATVPLYSQWLIVSHGFVWVIAFVFSALILRKEKARTFAGFSLAGTGAGFFDLLTAPLVTLSRPLLT